ncbi:MAG: DUF1735 domain-containing protein [Prolixibacteraceae bacterium]
MESNQMIKIYALVLAGMMLTVSCSNEVDYGEQYEKTIYMVNSNNLLYQAEHFYGEQNKMVFSVYCASSEPVTNDVTVQLEFDRNPLDSLNAVRTLSDPSYVARELLPQDHYELPANPEVTIRAGQQYGTLEVPFHVDDLDPLKPYTLPMTIVSNSSGYDMNVQLESIVYEPVMINGYSGSYTGISSESAKVARTVQPALKALSANTVLMPVHNLPGDMQYLDTNFMVLTIAADSATVTIAPHGNANVADLSGSSYDRERQRFELHYSFTATNNVTYHITEIIANVKAPVSEEDEVL